MILTLLNPFAASATRLDPKSAMAMLQECDAVLVDVRDPAELETGGFATGAVNVPLSAIPASADPDNAAHNPALRRDRPVIVYCASGQRSRMAGKVFRKLGYPKVYDMGPLSNWLGAGGKLAH